MPEHDPAKESGHSRRFLCCKATVVTDKRSHNRVALSVEATFQLSSDAGIGGQLKDISVGGAFLELGEAAETPAFGPKGTLVVELPGNKSPLELPSTVRWNKAGGIGLQFGLLGAKETHALSKLKS